MTEFYEQTRTETETEMNADAARAYLDMACVAITGAKDYWTDDGLDEALDIIEDIRRRI